MPANSRWDLIRRLRVKGYRYSFPGVQQPGSKVISYLQLASRLRISGATPLFPLYVHMAWTGTNLLARHRKKLCLLKRSAVKFYYGNNFNKRIVRMT